MILFIMSEESEAVTRCCASCGIAEIDDIKLKDCDGCDLVRYCSDECRQIHKPQHEEDCKKRAAELRDELLFKQPESSHMGDCPICCVPLPLDPRRYITYECCSKVICKGCYYANMKREAEAEKCLSCPFCREDLPATKEEAEKMRMKRVAKKIAKQRMKRVKANDPVAMREEGCKQNCKGNYRSAFDYFSKASDLGDVDAHYRLAWLYQKGHGVEKDEGKHIRHLEDAAIGGHPPARVLLGIYEYNKNNLDRAVKHWIIAATLGYDDAIKALMDGFKKGYVEKEVLAAAFRAHKVAVDATKSQEREFEEKVMREFEEKVMSK